MGYYDSEPQATENSTPSDQPALEVETAGGFVNQEIESEAGDGL